MTVGQTIKTLRKSIGLTQKELAEKLGLAPTAISAWERGANKPMMDSLSMMAELFGVPISYFYSKAGEHTLPGEPRNLYRVAAQTVRIPILGSISCGEPLLAEDNIKGYRNESADMLPSGELYYLEANGDSMEPSIPNGSLVLIRKQPEVENGQIAAVLINSDEEATLKRVRYQGDNMILYPDNSKHSPIFVSDSNPARIIGLAVEVKYKL